ncbi:MAG: hypothetical protein AAGE83_16470 [Pseudomonadota bacterium]
MESETTTRDARRHDLPAIAAIYGEAVVNGTGSFELEPPDVAEMEERWRAVVEARPLPGLGDHLSDGPI